MGTHIKIDGDPADVIAAGAALRSAAETFGAQIQAVSGEIDALDAERPWGDDEYGQAFYEGAYNTTPDDWEQPLRTATRDAMSTAGDALAAASDRIVRAVAMVEHTDTQNADDIAAAGEL